MFSAFKERRPWAAATTSFIFGPFIGMLYLNRGLLALAYFGLEIAAVIGAFAFVGPYDTAAMNSYLPLVISLPFRVVGAIHGFVTARRRSTTEAMHWYARWYAVVLIGLVLPASSALTIRTFLFQPFNIPSASMSPTLNIGDYFFVEKFAYDAATPQRGDVVVFRRERTDYVKRVVAVPGDRVRMVAGKLMINGVAAELRQVEDFKMVCNYPCPAARQFVESIPGTAPRRILQMTTDGPFDNTNAVVVPAGSYFLLGDNRDKSWDSRNFGFVPANAIVGKASIKWIDRTAHRWVWQPVK